MEQQRRSSGSKESILKELLFGFVAVVLGGYNLLNQFLWKFSFKAPEVLGNLVLIVVGLVLLATAFKLWRYRWHQSRLF